MKQMVNIIRLILIKNKEKIMNKIQMSIVALLSLSTITSAVTIGPILRTYNTIIKSYT
jgi:hypothetical protein